MTRQEYIENIVDFDDLIGFSDDCGCYLCECIYCESARDEYIDDCLRDMADNADSWQDLFNTLSEIPTGYDWYRLDDYDGRWEGLDDADFEEFKHDVLDWGDENGVWDDEEPDEEEPLVADNDDDDFVVADEPISIGELMGVCSSQLQQIGTDKQAKEAADDEAFEVFVAGCVTIVEGE